MSTEKASKQRFLLHFGQEDLGLEPNDPNYELGLKCVRTYWAQATRLNAFQQAKVIEYIRNREYATFFASDAGQHRLYQATMRGYDLKGAQGLSWPIYLILASVYKELPNGYIELIQKHYGSSVIEDHTQEYLEAVFDPRHTVYSILANQSVVAAKIALNLAADKIDADSGPDGQANQSTILEAVKHCQASSGNSTIETQSPQQSATNDSWNVDEAAAKVMQRFLDAAKISSRAARRLPMTDADINRIRKDVSTMKKATIQNERKLSVFGSDLRRFMAAFAIKAGSRILGKRGGNLHHRLGAANGARLGMFARRGGKAAIPPKNSPAPSPRE